MMKAIRITKDNKARLEQDYGMDKGELDISGGMYLLSEFGKDKAHFFLTPARFKMLYDEKSPLKNGFTAVALKS